MTPLNMTLNQLIEILIRVRNARNGDGTIPVRLMDNEPVCAIYIVEDAVLISGSCP
jgi:hypothetical protein